MIQVSEWNIDPTSLEMVLKLAMNSESTSEEDPDENKTT